MKVSTIVARYRERLLQARQNFAEGNAELALYALTDLLDRTKLLIESVLSDHTARGQGEIELIALELDLVDFAHEVQAVQMRFPVEQYRQEIAAIHARKAGAA